MNELETRLEALGMTWVTPDPPDLTDVVLASRPVPRRNRGRVLRIALVAAAVAIGAVAAIAPARNAILDFFRIGGVDVRRVETLPPAGDSLELGRRVSAQELRTSAPWFPQPSFGTLGPADEAWLSDAPDGGTASLIWRTVPAGGRQGAAGVGLLFSGFQGYDVTAKLLGQQTRLERLTLGGEDAIWLTGGPHVVGRVDRHGNLDTESTRLAGNVLIWQRGPVTLRLEGQLDRAAMIALAAQVR